MKLFRFGPSPVLTVVLLSTAGAQAQTVDPPCTGLCLQQVQCPNGGTTSISGTVYAPNGTDPIPNVTVYIPNATVPALTAGVTCPVPGALPSGSPLVGTFTAPDGTFSIGNVPVGSNIPLVILAGKWRRQITIPQTAACTNTAVSGARFPVNQTEGDIPKFAVVTGNADQVECVLRKVGIQDAEFTNPGGSGRIQLFRAKGATGDGNAVTTPGQRNAAASGAEIDSTTPLDSALLGDSQMLNSYDLLMLPCEGGAHAEPADQLANLLSFANSGGRIYASHFAWEWMYQNGSFQNAAQWLGQSTSLSTAPLPATVNQSFGGGVTLAKWLDLTGASTSPGVIDVAVTRSDISGVNSPTQVWLTLNQTGGAMQFTFGTPVGQVNSQCGRVLFNEYHVENPPTSGNTTFSPHGVDFPLECPPGAMTPQEKLLEYSLFDLANDGGPATIAPSSADFGNQAVGFTSAPKTFTVTNNSVFTSTLTAASATGDFVVSGNTCNSVPAGSTCTLSVVFTPTVLGPRTGSLAVTFAGTSLTAALTGTGIPPFAASAGSLTFGSLDVGASATQSLQILNQAPGPLPFPALTVTGDYKTSTTCPTAIPAGGSCVLNVTFTPTATGSRTGAITPTIGSPITLTGNGVDFAVKFLTGSDTVIAGLSDSNTLTASGIAGFNAPVTLSCTSTAPVSACTVASTGFTLTGSSIPVKTTVTTQSQYTLAGYGYTSPWIALFGTLSLTGLLALRRRFPALARAGLLCTGLWFAAAALSGCSGKIPGKNATYTPAGAYTVTITATDGFLTHSASYQLTVKEN